MYIRTFFPVRSPFQKLFHSVWPGIQRCNLGFFFKADKKIFSVSCDFQKCFFCQQTEVWQNPITRDIQPFLMTCLHQLVWEAEKINYAKLEHLNIMNLATEIQKSS